jgi:hypothetical protein
LFVILNPLIFQANSYRCTVVLEELIIALVTLEMHTIFWVGNLKGKDYSEYIDVDGRIILKWILWKSGGKL